MHIQPVCVRKTSLRRSSRSMTAPANGERKKTGSEATKSISPSALLESVRRKTSQPIATRYIHSPVIEIIWAVKKSR